MQGPVLFALDDGVLRLTLNRPDKKNAFDDP
jgi:enoyl-CoA hydratase/carnithine racemase